MAGIKGYTTNITNQTPEFVIGAYHRLGHIEKAFRIVVVDRPRAQVMPGHWGSTATTTLSPCPITSSS